MLGLFTGVVTAGHAQQENVWAFGLKAGLDFNTTPPTAIQTKITGFGEANASVCNASGQLLFYTEGFSVWDKNGDVMPNGSDLAPIPGAPGSTSTSSTQGAVIVPMPGNASQYYVFSLTSFENGPDLGRLYYSVVDMSLNSGLGAVITGQKAILLDTLLTERMTAVVGDRCNVWLLAVSRSPFRFKAYEITAAGINGTPVVSNVGLDNSVSGLIGCISVAPNRKRIALAQNFQSGSGHPATLYRFDAVTGIVTQPLVIFSNTPDAGNGGYGICFSPDNTKVYVNIAEEHIYQFDLSSNDSATISLSKTLIGDAGFSHLKLAPDGKIYFQSTQTGNRLGAINFPDNASPACGYNANALTLLPGTFISLGLPNAVPVFKQDTVHTAQAVKPPCFTGSLVLQATNDTTGWDYQWNNGMTGPVTTVATSGTYWVSYREPPCRYHVDTFRVTIGSYLPIVAAVAGCKNDTNAMAWAVPTSGDTITYNYTWSNLGNQVIRGPSQSNSGDTLRSIFSGETYTLKITAANGCDTTLFITTPLPDYRASFTVSDSIICMGDTVAFQNTSAGGFVHYQWQLTNGATSTLENPKHVFTHAGSYTIRMAAQTAYPCYDTAYKNIIVDSVLPANFLTDRNNICKGQSIVFYPQTDSTTLNLSWDFGDGTGLTAPNGDIQHAYDQEGAMPVLLTSHFRACPDVFFTDTAKVYPLPLVSLGPDSSLCLNGAPIILINRQPAPAGVYHQLWNTGETAESLKVVHPGTYSLTLSLEPLGCSTTETITVHKDCYMDIPNAFTPNGDGVNDYLFPRQLLTRKVTQFHMQVLNRWGQVIFRTNRTDGRGWDGRFNGKDQPQGVYVYVIEAEIDGHLPERYQGNVTLIR